MVTIHDSASATETEVKEIAGLLSKAAKNYQIYLPNNRMFISSLENLKVALDRFLEENDVLTFVVKEFDLIHDDVPVYSSTDKHQSIAFRMYRDGVRLLSFHKGISEDELLAFFEALTRCMETDSSEEDFVTLLWVRDLQAITFYEVNDFEADYEGIEKGARKAAKAKPADLATSDFPQDRSTNVSDEVERLKPALSLSPKEVEEVRDLAIAVEDDFFLKRAWHVLSCTLESDEPQGTHTDLEPGLIGFLDTCVAKRQLGLAADALTSIRSHYDEVMEEEVAQVLSRIVASRHSAKNMEIIARILSAGREVEQVQCLAYLSRLNSDAIPAVLKLLPECGRQSARQSVISALASLGGTCPAEIVKSVDRNIPDDVDAAVDVLETIGTEAAMACAMQFRDHAAPRIRAKVATLAGSLRTDGALGIAQALIKDEDHSVRRRAIVSLVKIGGDQCTEILVDLFTSKEFGLLSHDCKLSMLVVIRNLSPGGQERIIEAVFGMKALFKRKSIEDTKLSLIEIMHLMNQEVASEMLGKMIAKSSGRLRKAAEAALEKVNRADRIR